LFWVIAALAVMLAERGGRRARRTGWSTNRIALAPLGLVAGVVLMMVVPTHAHVLTPFDAIPLPLVVDARGDQVYYGAIWRNTVCGTAEAVKLPDGVELECQDRFRTPGFGQLRVDAPSLAKAREGTATLVAALQEHSYGIRFHAATSDSGRPTWALTAPVWGGIIGLLLAMFCRIPAPADEATRVGKNRLLEPATVDG
jgi:hypothetical protein